MPGNPLERELELTLQGLFPFQALQTLQAKLESLLHCFDNSDV